MFKQLVGLSVVLYHDGRSEQIVGGDDDEPGLHVTRLVLKQEIETTF
jgi:hypothetical protein